MTAWKEFIKGIWDENPVFRMLMGMCPTLAVTNAAINGMAMGLATAFVLICSNIIVALVKRFIPDEVRIPSYIIIIATFVTIADLFLAAYFPEIHKVLGLFIPLIVVNCIILGRAEGFASKNNVWYSALDAVGMGIGFTFALTLLGIIREIMGMGSIFNIAVTSSNFTPWVIFVLPPGAFLTLGIMLWIINSFSKKKTTESHCH
ncbi:electron transport complex subunit E [Petroclostridium sp. X23]|uniref:electron transport complex subunit RsxE n=1 Tax=Petroclostridium sp. X23 TaxID=3045146 RepID=UPI0024ACBC23|nr:electron transport complex subunit E [Petroclostridium sp. X23]WHH59991.1 electron transport complex subunit E [Petroclostridium sp. X23]